MASQDDYNPLPGQEANDHAKQGSHANENNNSKEVRIPKWMLVKVPIQRWVLVTAVVVIVAMAIAIVVLTVNVDNNNNCNNNDNNNNNDESNGNIKTSTDKYYVVVNKSLNYFDANEYCSSMYGTSLTTIFDMYQNNIVKDLCTWSNNNGNNNSTSGDGCWIGYTKSDTLLDKSDYIVESVNGKGWFWLWYNTTNNKIDWTSPVDIFTVNDTNSDDDDKSTLTNNFKNWNGDYQTVEQNTECAILLSKNGTWLSQACNKRYPFVCNYYLKVESFLCLW